METQQTWLKNQTFKFSLFTQYSYITGITGKCLEFSEYEIKETKTRFFPQK